MSVEIVLSVCDSDGRALNGVGCLLLSTTGDDRSGRALIPSLTAAKNNAESKNR